MFSCLSEIHLFKVDHAELAIGFEMIWVLFYDKFVVLDWCVNVACQGVYCFTQTIVSNN